MLTSQASAPGHFPLVLRTSGATGLPVVCLLGMASRKIDEEGADERFPKAYVAETRDQTKKPSCLVDRETQCRHFWKYLGVSLYDIRCNARGL